MNFDYAQSVYVYKLFGSDMYKDWTIELKGMVDRIFSMRQELYEALQARGFGLMLLFSSIVFVFVKSFHKL